MLIKRSVPVMGAVVLTALLVPAAVYAAQDSPARPAIEQTDVPTLDGGLSHQALVTARRSPLARTAVQLYQPFETGDVSIYRRILTADFTDVPLAPKQQPGRHGMALHVLNDIVATFPDARFHIEAIHVDRNVVTVRGLFTGTQEGDFLGVPATHRQLSYRTVDIHQFRGGRIHRTDHLEDFFGAYQQMTR